MIVSMLEIWKVSAVISMSFLRALKSFCRLMSFRTHYKLSEVDLRKGHREVSSNSNLDRLM